MKVDVDWGELNRNNNKENPDSSQAFKLHAMRESISSRNMLNILNHSGKQDCSCGKAVGNFRGRKLLFNEMNRYCLEVILGKRDRN